jgi:DNA ligase, NAD-dependent
MNLQQAHIRAEELRALIREHNKRYYLDNAPVISDFEYDILLHELESIEKKFPSLYDKNSPTQKVGSDNLPHLAQFPHRYPMLSLSNSYDEGEIREFDQRIRKATDREFHYVCELKFDGTAICLTYEKGVLVRALTRGDGQKGDNVTANVLQIPEIPSRVSGAGLPDVFEIRGEIILPFEAFDRLNAERAANEEALFANPRNAAAGSLKLLDYNEVARRGLSCFLYHVLGESLPSDSHFALMQLAKTWGFPVLDQALIQGRPRPAMALCENIEEVMAFLASWSEARRALPFATDGVVIKVDGLSLQRALGMTAKSPRWATAFKFKAEQAQTPLLTVEYQVGRTGAITPVAQLAPVLLSGSTVKRASLHNAEQIALLDLRIGDTVVVEKGGEIIPKITAIVPELRPAQALPIDFITHCPECGTALVRDEGEAKFFCSNILNCPPQVMGRILHFMSRKAMNILGGEALVAQLYQRGWLVDVSDLYRLNREQLLSLDGFKDKSADNLLESIAASRTVAFPRVLYALGIRFVGETTAKYLAQHFGSLQAIEQASDEELQQSPEVGEVLTQSIRNFFAQPRNQAMIQALREAGLALEVGTQANTLLSETFINKQFVISGNFSISRETLKALIEQHGGKVLGQVSSQTTYLVAGDKAGPAKLQKAQKLQVEVLSEQALQTLIQQAP